MRITDFAKEVAKEEGKLKSVNIGQIMEVLRVSNDMTDGELYRLIRKMVYVQV